MWTHGGCSESVQEDAILRCGHLVCIDIRACEVWARAEGTGIISTNATGRCATRRYHFCGVLNACASIMALEEGRRGHEHIIQSGCESDAFVGSSLIDMYAKCGSMEEASRVDEGLHFYALMTTVYRIPAKLEHCTCMVDLLGHAGHLQEADNIIQGMPCKPDAAVWIALLAACRIHGNLEMGERVAKRVLELKPENAAGYVLLPNLYAATGNLELSENVERQRKERDVKKQPGCTWIEVNDVVHTFVVDDQTHP